LFPCYHPTGSPTGSKPGIELPPNTTKPHLPSPPTNFVKTKNLVPMTIILLILLINK
jgi:hypothetical protein